MKFNYAKLLIIVFIGLLSLSGCKKKTLFIYEIDPVNVEADHHNKTRLKDDIQFMSIAYRDLFGVAIPPDMRVQVGLPYLSFGDKGVLTHMFFLNFFNDPDVSIPSNAEMRANPDQFVEDAYRKFFLRKPGEFEKWFITHRIESDTSVTPQAIWFSFLTSQEYKYY